MAGINKARNPKNPPSGGRSLLNMPITWSPEIHSLLDINPKNTPVVTIAAKPKEAPIIMSSKPKNIFTKVPIGPRILPKAFKIIPINLKGKSRSLAMALSSFADSERLFVLIDDSIFSMVTACPLSSIFCVIVTALGATIQNIIYKTTPIKKNPLTTKSTRTKTKSIPK